MLGSASMSDDRSPLEVEILAEQVRALTRATQLLEESLRQLVRFDALPAPPRHSARARVQLLDEARRLLWNLVVQREAMGIVHHQVLYEVLEIPPEVGAPMGGWAGPP
jgi:hypothetical protein